MGGLALTGCLHIIEDVTLRNNGSGTYKMTLDMSEVKGMMEMLKTMTPDSSATDSTGAPVMAAPGQDNQMAQMGQELSGVSTTLKGVQGITNVVETNDTAGFQFGYTFDFVDVAALNRALRIINKEKYDSKTEEIFRLKGKSFERLSSGDIGAELKKALAENESDEAGGNAEMMQMFFADMTYKQVYHFPDRMVKKSTNELSEVTDDGHTLTINLKPFDQEQQKKKISVATEVKLK